MNGAKANTLADPVADNIKEERYHRFMQVQAEISRKKLQAKIGSLQTVLVDNITEEHIIARSQSDAPEIDGLVYVKSHRKFSIGDHLSVRITHSDYYDLFGHQENV